MFDFLALHGFDLIAQSTPGGVDSDLINQCTSSLISVDSFALNCGAAYSEYVANSWDQNWQDKIGVASPEFVALLNISRYIAGPMVALWAIDGLRKLLRNGLTGFWGEFVIIVMLVYGLYANDGLVIRNTTLAARALINHQNNIILQVASIGENFENKLFEIADFTNAENKIIEIRSQCNGIVNNDDLLACLQGAEIRAQQVLDNYRAVDDTSAWRARLDLYVDSTITQFIESPERFNIAAAVANPLIKMVLEGIMASMNLVIQNLVELSWLLTAVIAPIPFAIGFYPGSRGAIISWSVAFLSLGLFKINFNMANSVVVTMLYNRGPADGLGDMILLGLGTPLLASAMTAGGGMAIFNGISMAISAVSVGLLRLSTGGGGGE